MSTWSRDLVNYHDDFCHVRYHPVINLSKFGDIWLQLLIVMSNLNLSLVSMLSHTGPILKPRQQLPVQVAKLPTTFSVFLRVLFTLLGRWLVIFKKIPRDYRCSLTREEGNGWEHLRRLVPNSDFKGGFHLKFE